LNDLSILIYFGWIWDFAEGLFCFNPFSST